jgi:hypothetical protein
MTILPVAIFVPGDFLGDTIFRLHLNVIITEPQWQYLQVTKPSVVMLISE